MKDELFDELKLRRALRLDPTDQVRLDARALADAAEAAEHARFARWFLGALGLALALPSFAFARVIAAVVNDPSLMSDPLALGALAAGPLLNGLAVLAQPATALAAVAAVAIFTVNEGREHRHAHATRT